MKNRETVHPLFCDPVTGVCEVPGTGTLHQVADMPASSKKIRVIYFTDPICSSCWGIEPQLKKLKLEYGHHLDLEYRMGGLLKSWDSYGGRDVNGPESVAKHWDEAGAYYEMPLDGDLWLEDPLHSSYPPAIAFKAAQLQGAEKAGKFLRRIKEMVFLEKKNITRWPHLADAAVYAGLDVAKFKTDFDGHAVQFFEQDLDLARQLGVRGFPSIFFTDEDNNRFLVYGSRSYEHYETALLKLYPDVVKQQYDQSWENLFKQYPTLTTREFAVLANRSTEQATELMERLAREEKILRQGTRNGVLWKAKSLP